MKKIILFNLFLVTLLSVDYLNAQSNLNSLADNRNPREKRTTNIGTTVMDTLKTNQNILADIANVGYNLTKGSSANLPDPTRAEIAPAALPLTSFTSNVYNNQVILKWSAAMALNETGYTIERMEGGGSWKNIGTVRNGNETQDEFNYIFTDAAPLSGDNMYRITQRVGSSSLYSTTKNVEFLRGSKGMVFQNYPNPFNTVTTIRYEMREAGNVKIAIYNTNGLLVKILANQTQAKGSYTLNWNSADAPIGTYFCKIYTDNDNVTTTMIKTR